MIPTTKSDGTEVADPSIRAILIFAQYWIIIERNPYAPDVEFQSRPAHVFARKAAGSASDSSGTS